MYLPLLTQMIDETQTNQEAECNSLFLLLLFFKSWEQFLNLQSWTEIVNQHYIIN